MGVQRTHYVMLAAKLPFDTFDFDKDYKKYHQYEDNGYEFKVTEHNGLTIISDGMNGEYVFIGKVIKKVLEYDALVPTNCSVFSPEERYIIADSIKIEFGIEVVVDVWAFTHCH